MIIVEHPQNPILIIKAPTLVGFGRFRVSGPKRFREWRGKLESGPRRTGSKGLGFRINVADPVRPPQSRWASAHIRLRALEVLFFTGVFWKTGSLTRKPSLRACYHTQKTHPDATPFDHILGNSNPNPLSLHPCKA